jgi:hypothetical protein
VVRVGGDSLEEILCEREGGAGFVRQGDFGVVILWWLEFGRFWFSVRFAEILTLLRSAGLRSLKSFYKRGI